MARHSGTTVADGRMECCERLDWLGARRHVNGVASWWPPCRSSPSPASALLWAWLRRLGRVHDPTVWCAAMRPHVRFNGGLHGNGDALVICGVASDYTEICRVLKGGRD